MKIFKTISFISFLLVLSPMAFGQTNKNTPPSPKQQQIVTEEDLQAQREQMQKDREEFEAMIEEQFKQSNDLIKQFLDQNDMRNFQKNFRQMFRDFQNMQDMDDAIFTTPGMQKLLQQDIGGAREQFEKEWVDGPEKNQVTLILKVKQSTNQPLNIKIEKGTLRLKGTIKQERKDSNGRVFSTYTSTVDIQEPLGRDDILPDPINMLQDKDGHLRFIFSKRELKVIKRQRQPERRQIRPKKGEKTI